LTGAPLIQIGDSMMTVDAGHTYTIDAGLYRLFVDPGTPDRVTKNVQEFYGRTPFPNYEGFDTVQTFIQRADRTVFFRLLSKQLPINAHILEVGCGTGQLSNYLAATTMSRVYATDMTIASLRLGQKFAAGNAIQGIKFIQMNLFYPCIKPGSMDLVISNGVLHHTADTKAALFSIVKLVKPGGHIIIGLYNTIGRLRTDVRRYLYRIFGDKVLFLDPQLRQVQAAGKRHAWVQDQYCHPSERKHTISETIGWFKEAGFTFVSSIPKIIGEFRGNEQLFEPTSPGSRLDRFYAELGMLFGHLGGEGGLFMVIARRPLE
jgi:2-polyprenyl-3-methyl-5-hydroxy-6-metoxy-1,4-benzoquinol methylase